MTNNENWQGRPRRTVTNASRDGKAYEKRDMKSILKGSRGNSFDNSDTRRSNYERNDNRQFHANRGENRQFSPGQGDSRRFNSDRGENRQYSSNQGENRRFNADRGEGRRFNSEGNEGQRPDNRQGGRPRITVKKPNSYENIKETRFNDSEGSRRPRITVRKPGSEGFGENRFENRDSGFRPRVRTSDYNPNAKYSKKKQIEYRRNEIDFSKPVRLNKFLANAGICSRREADEFIKTGVISVNGEIVTEMGVKVMHSDKILFHNQLVRSERKVYLLLNKPKDTVTTAEDTHDRTTVLDLVKNACSERIYPVGRLDRNTTGVLLLTNDGDLASRLTHPKYNKKKIYHVTLDKPLEIPDFESVIEGVTLDDEKVAADALNFLRDDDFRQLGIEIHSGQNRVVRRIFEKLGYKVVRLDRVFFAGLTKKNLPRGKYRFLSEKEVNMLKMGAFE
ncbi:pseudouridine synthase [Paludibacter sp.]